MNVKKKKIKNVAAVAWSVEDRDCGDGVDSSDGDCDDSVFEVAKSKRKN